MWKIGCSSACVAVWPSAEKIGIGGGTGWGRPFSSWCRNCWLVGTLAMD